MLQNPPAAIGCFYYGNKARVKTRSHGDGAGSQGPSVTLAFDTATNASDYTVTVTGGNPEVQVTATYTTASTSAADLRDGILAELQADPLMGLIGIPRVVGSSIVVQSHSGAPVKAALVANPGSAITATPSAGGFTQYVYGQAVQVAQDDTITPPSVSGASTLLLDVSTNAASANSTTTLIVDGQAQVVSAASGANAGATATSIAAAFNAAGFSAAVQNTDEVLVSFAAGQQIGLVGVDNTSTLVVAPTFTQGASDPAPLALVIFDNATELPALGPKPGHATKCAHAMSGALWAVAHPSDGDPALGAPVYADALGVLYTRPAGDRRIFPGATWVRPLSSGIAAIAL